MKRISRLLFLSIFLASCADAVTPIPNVAVTSFAEVTATFTSVPTSTPTKVSPNLTETPDPNRPSDATGYDENKGMFTKTAEDGETTEYWMPFQYGFDAENGITGHWTENKMLNGQLIYLFDNKMLSNNASYLVNSMPFEQYKQTDIYQLQSGYALYHPDQMSEFGMGAELYPFSFPMQLRIAMIYRFFNRGPADGIDYSHEEQAGFREAIVDGTAGIPVGNEFWNFAKGYRQYVVDYTTASGDPSFQKTDGYYWKIMIVDGQLTSFIATPELDKLSDVDMRIMAFAPLWEVLLDSSFMPGKLVTSFDAGPGRAAASNFSLMGSSEGITYKSATVQPTIDFMEIQR